MGTIVIYVLWLVTSVWAMVAAFRAEKRAGSHADGVRGAFVLFLCSLLLGGGAFLFFHGEERLEVLTGQLIVFTAYAIGIPFLPNVVDKARILLSHMGLKVEPPASFSPSEKFVADLMAKLVPHCFSKGIVLPEELRQKIQSFVRTLYVDEFWRTDGTFHPALTTAIEARITHKTIQDAFEEKLLNALRAYVDLLPKFGDASPLKTPLFNVVNAGQAFRDMENQLYPRPYHAPQHYGFFETLAERSYARYWAITQHHIRNDKKLAEGARINPFNFPGSVGEMVDAYCKGTPFYDLLTVEVSLPLTDEIRWENQFIVCPPGSGKTQLIQAQIAADLERVKAGTASVIVIDSQGTNEGRPDKPRTLVQNLINLKVFAKGQPLEGKLTYIRPSSRLSFNLLDMGSDDPNLTEREALIRKSNVLDMIEYCVRPDSDQQKVMLSYIVRLAMLIPGATIDTVKEILSLPQDRFTLKYGRLLKSDTTRKDIRDFFTDTFFQGGGRRLTREALHIRVDGLMSSSDIFGDMFNHDRNSINLLEEIEAGKVIVIDTDKELLKETASAAFGRFFIALLLQATLSRRTSKSAFCYIDECHEYHVGSDAKIFNMILQARKQHVGMVFATQYLENITSPKVRTALSSVAIKIGGRNTEEAAEVAKLIDSSADFLRSRPKGHFGVFVLNVTNNGAIPAHIRPNIMEDMPRMSELEYAEVHAPKPSPQSPPPPSSPSSPPPAPNPANDDPVFGRVK